MGENEDQDGDAVDKVLDAVTTAVTGIPAPIQKSATKAFSRLITAAVEIPASMLEGMVEERRAITAARVAAIRATGENIAGHLDVDRKFALAAGHKYAEKIVGRQKNVDAVALIAAEQLSLDSSQDGEEPAQATPSDGPSDDWLNNFEREAELASSEDMRARLGKILAGEIQRPGSFSIRSVQLLAQLDQHTAKLFQTLCSLSVSLSLPIPAPELRRSLDSRVCSIAGSAATNTLQKFGLSFDGLNHLHEAGLIIADYNSYMNYDGAIAREGKVSLPFEYAGNHWALVKTDESSANQLRLNGVRFSRVGTELRPIVEISENVDYSAALRTFFEGQGYTMTLVNMSPHASPRTDESSPPT